jgi:2-polyprenyl-3-methyl-5-hydroxy-6-metoxy-1,4-benzoquinol methylase
METNQTIQADFDAIARATPQCGRPNYNNRYHSLILKHLSRKRARALDIGCGTGDLISLLAAEFGSVTGIDFSHEMIERARTNLAERDNVTLLEKDVLAFQPDGPQFDTIVSVATFHHLPLERIFRLCAEWLAPDGVLIVLDLYRARSLTDVILAGIAVVANAVDKLIGRGYGCQTPAERAAWNAHGKHEHYSSLNEIGHATGKVLPGAEVRRLSYWRYLLVYHKGADR